MIRSNKNDSTSGFYASSSQTEAFARRHNVAKIFAEFSESIEEEIQELISLRDSGQSPIPSVSFQDIKENGFTDEEAALIRKRGCVVVRNTFERSKVVRWEEELDNYLNVANRYHQNLAESIEAGNNDRARHKNIYDIFWSKPQIEIRQSACLNVLQQRLNGIWRNTEPSLETFDPYNSYSYADRVRIRKPSGTSRGIPPHVDSCSIEPWLFEDTLEQSHGNLFNGNWREYDAFNSIRCLTQARPHQNSSGIFRTYQGWMALTPQGPRTGSLQLVPSSRCVAWMLLCELNMSLRGDAVKFPVPGESLLLDPVAHNTLIQGLCSIPQVGAGDTVWWHPEVVHAVESINESETSSSVVYLGIAPVCKRNADYIQSQKNSFIEGLSPPDFPAINEEQNYIGRGVREHLSPLGAQQMGFES